MADAYFSMATFAGGLGSMGFHLVSRLHDAKQFTGLYHSQARDIRRLDFAFKKNITFFIHVFYFINVQKMLSMIF